MLNTNDIIIRTPYNQRSTWMQEIHRTYGPSSHLMDIDSLMDTWIEHKSGELVALVEYKQDYETIELFRYTALIKLANNSKMPFFISVGYKQLPSYYCIPMNEYAKNIPTMNKEHFWSERNYVKMLHWLRKISTPYSVLEGKSNKLPNSDTKLPNIKR